MRIRQDLTKRVMGINERRMTMSLELSKKAAAVKPSSTLAITAKAKELKAQGKDVVGFGAGEPDFNTPENICNAAIDAIKSGFTKYTPASGTNELKEAISKKFKSFNNLDYAPDQIVISNGGKHSLTNIFTALINPGDEVIIPGSVLVELSEIVKLAGGVPAIVKTTKEQNYKLTVDDLTQITDKTKALVLNTPNNPTGMLYTEEELRAIAEVVVANDFYTEGRRDVLRISFMASRSMSALHLLAKIFMTEQSLAVVWQRAMR